MTAIFSDRTANAFFGFKPSGVGANSSDWHYGFGFWKECDEMTYSQSCDESPVISSPGAFGFTPWIDLGNEYWGVIAIQESSNGSALGVALEQDIQSLIEAALLE